jgi:hypothetical protein
MARLGVEHVIFVSPVSNMYAVEVGREVMSAFEVAL